MPVSFTARCSYCGHLPCDCTERPSLERRDHHRSCHFGRDAECDCHVYWREERDELLAALKGVVRVADRKTDEFDAARAAIAKAEGDAKDANVRVTVVTAQRDELLALVREASEIVTITYAGNFPAGIESFLVRAADAIGKAEGK